MANISPTFSGDFSSFMVGKIFDIISDAKSERAKADKEAAKYGVDVDFTPGEFTARSARNSLIESTLGRRFVPQTRYPDLLARGQFSSDPLMGTPANVRKLPEYQQLANPQERLFNNSSYITGKNVPSSGTRGTTSTTGQKPVKVKDEKLGVYLAAVIKSLNASIASINERLDDTESGVIQAKEGIFGTIKQLEQNSDLLETKLDAIIDALRDQNNLAKIQEDDSQIQRREEEVEKENDLSDTQRIVKPDEKKEDTVQLNLLEDIQDQAEKREEQLSLPFVGGDEGFERGGIASGPDSGYLVKLHGDEAVIPIDNNYTQGEPSAVDSVVRKPPVIAQAYERGTTPAPISRKSSPIIGGDMTNIFASSSMVDGQTAEMRENASNLQQAMSFVTKGAGIITMATMQDAVSNMGGLAGTVASQLKEISNPLASAFGIPNTITNSLIRGQEAKAETSERKKQTRNFSTSDDKAWWDPLGLFTGRGRGGPGTPTGSTNVYNRMRGTGGPGTTYNRGTGGLPGTGRVLKPLTTRNSAGGYETRLETQMHFLGIPVPFTKGRYRGDSGNARYGSLWPLKDADSRSGVERFNQNPDRPYNLVPSYEGSDMVRPEAIPERSVRTAPSQSSPTNRYGETESSDPLTNMVRGLRDAYIPESRIKAIEEIRGKPLGDTTYGEFQRQLMDQYGSSTRGEQMRQMQERGLLGPQSSAPAGRMSDNIAMVDYSSRQQAMSRLNKQTMQPDPIIINNQTAEGNSPDMSISHIANMGDPGLSSLYPSIS